MTDERSQGIPSYAGGKRVESLAQNHLKKTEKFLKMVLTTQYEMRYTVSVPQGKEVNRMPRPPLDGENVMKNITIRITEKDLDKIKAVARSEKRTYSDLIRIVIMDYVERHEVPNV